MKSPVHTPAFRLAWLALYLVLAAAPGAAEERWYTLELAGERVGYARQQSDRVPSGAGTVERTRLETRTELRRASGDAVERLVVTSTEEWREDEAGRPLTVESVQDGGGGAVTQVRGELAGDVLRLRVTGAGGERTLELPWAPEVLAPAALERRLRSFLDGAEPELSYRSLSLEALSVLDVHVRVLRRDATGLELASSIPALGVATREWWTREQGLVRQEMGPLVMRLATREEALARLPSTLAPFQALTLRAVGPRQPRRGDLVARYALVPRDGAPPPALGELFPADAQQRVLVENGREILLVAVPARDVKVPPSPSPAPADTYLAPSTLLESDDPELRRAAAAAAGEGSPVERARRLERWVHESVRYRGSGVGFGSAVGTLRSRDGDCTEHAVLLAALLRAVGIPSRLVVGVAWADAGEVGPAFVPHAWTEAWSGDRWLPLDAALYGPGIDATHLAMARSDGADGAAVVDLAAPLLRGLGRFDLELLGAEAPAGRGTERR